MNARPKMNNVSPGSPNRDRDREGKRLLLPLDVTGHGKLERMQGRGFAHFGNGYLQATRHTDVVRSSLQQHHQMSLHRMLERLQHAPVPDAPEYVEFLIRLPRIIGEECTRHTHGHSVLSFDGTAAATS